MVDTPFNDKTTAGSRNRVRQHPAETAAPTINPCPFSKNYGIPQHQAWLLLKVYLIYRLMLAGLFLILFYSRIGPSMLGSHDEILFNFSCLSYVILTVISALCIFRRLSGYTLQAQSLIFTDIVIITLIMHACGGINSGLGILLAVSIATGGLLIGGRCAMLFAALAALAVLAEQIYAAQTHSFDNTSFTYSGMLGASFFAIALLSFVLAQRTEASTVLAAQRQRTIDQLQELNQYIIQHLQSGIIITDQDQKIQMSNGAALRLARLRTMPDDLDEISEDLSHAFTLWLHDPNQDFALLHLPGGIVPDSRGSAVDALDTERRHRHGADQTLASAESEIQIRFMLLPTQQEIFHMIILEDISLYNQRLQQSKLASLGRLTASIAHEIRNPLGAIGHAGQLLFESPQLSKEDQRLTEIIQAHTLRVNKIIEDILQVSRRKASTRKKINLVNWLHHYLNNYLLEHDLPPDTFKQSIEVTEPLSIVMDPEHLKQIMDNLSNNALKYGQPELGPIVLAVQKYGDTPCIEVIDSGPGIAANQQHHLFEPFFTTSANGTGLGLYISRELAELNQAQLSYHLTEAGKSCFRLCLPNAEQTIIEI